MRKLFLLLAAVLCFIPIKSFAMVEIGTQTWATGTVQYPLVYLDNKAAQNKVNAEIAKLVYSLKSGELIYGDYIPMEYIGEQKMNYKVTYEDANVLSLYIFSYQYNKGAAHGMGRYNAMVFNKQSGDLIPLSYYAGNINPSYLNYYVKNGEIRLASMYDDRRISPYNLYKDIEVVSNNYILLGDGYIEIIYPAYSIAPFSVGDIGVVLSPRDLLLVRS